MTNKLDLDYYETITTFRSENGIVFGYTEDEMEVEKNYIPRAMTTADVRRETSRRVLIIMNEEQQRNALISLTIDGPNEHPDIVADFAAIKNIQFRSKEIEKLEPIPFDFTDDKYWT